MFLSQLTERTDETVRAFVYGVWGAFQREWFEALAVLLAIAFAFLGYQLWTGAASLRDLQSKSVRLLIALALVPMSAPFQAIVYDLVTAVPEAVGGTLTQAIRPTEDGTQQNPAAGPTVTRAALTADLDSLLADAGAASVRIVQNAGVLDVPTVVLGWFITLVTVVFIAGVAIVLLVAKVAVGIFLALTPFAILMLFYDSTRSLFEGWLRQLLGFSLAPVFLFTLLGLMMSLVSQFSDPVLKPGAQVAELPSLADVAVYFAVMATAIGLTTQVVSWSSGVAGAMALSVTKALSPPVAAARLLQEGARSAARAPEAAKRDAAGNVVEQRRLRQVAYNAGAFVDGAVRSAVGLRPARRADPSWRPPVASPPPPRTGTAKESAPAGPAAPAQDVAAHAVAEECGAMAAAGGASSRPVAPASRTVASASGAGSERIVSAAAGAPSARSTASAGAPQASTRSAEGGGASAGGGASSGRTGASPSATAAERVVGATTGTPSARSTAHAGPAQASTRPAEGDAAPVGSAGGAGSGQPKSGTSLSTRESGAPASRPTSPRTASPPKARGEREE